MRIGAFCEIHIGVEIRKFIDLKDVKLRAILQKMLIESKRAACKKIIIKFLTNISAFEAIVILRGAKSYM